QRPLALGALPAPAAPGILDRRGRRPQSNGLRPDARYAGVSYSSVDADSWPGEPARLRCLLSRNSPSLADRAPRACAVAALRPLLARGLDGPGRWLADGLAVFTVRSRRGDEHRLHKPGTDLDGPAGPGVGTAHHGQQPKHREHFAEGMAG